MKKDFDPNGVGIANGNIFGFPVTHVQADIVLYPFPWDATASYGRGTAGGPAAILRESTQLDFYNPYVKKAYNTKVYWEPIDERWEAVNEDLSSQTTAYIDYLEEGGKLEESEKFTTLVQEMNAVQTKLKEEYKAKIAADLKQNKLVGVIGGEHSTPLALIEALAEQTKFGILQIDAHADLRDAYENFEQSHASIMFNALKLENVEKLVQVGIRDIAQSEVDIIEANPKRVRCFYDWELKEENFGGKTWKEQVEDIIASLPNKVYISYDIDGLKPSLCPNTGTPVPGGFDLEQINYLLYTLARSNKEIIGFDLCEVGDDAWDANVGARALWNVICALKLNKEI
ncbi:agmatinase [Lishizhenia tianjinensis]|uniref:Agmatinase n=1 Tax=Lishizhenia tianjinensis TaxID=477690 RepID=A0A1I7AET8_9FLAO|nr:agmatinase family protein [Lishizhenia tianjinensis]SFT73462.1 agmatinase [Lishizhenia tianjinensis]